MRYSRMLALAAALLPAVTCAAAAIEGLVTRPSAYPASVTLERLEGALTERGFTIFARLDHAAAAESVGLKMPKSTVVVFGTPRIGTPNFLVHPTLAIDLPLKALVWEDADGKVWLSYNSAQHLAALYARHGGALSAEATTRLEGSLAALADAAVQ